MANIQENLENLQGSIERVTFHSAETGFCVLRTRVKDRPEIVTIVANAASVSAGEHFECSGSWVRDKKHGLQFKAQQMKKILPSSLEGMEKYLSSGMVKGVGEHFAQQLIEKFGDKVFEVIESQPERLAEITGLGKKRREIIIKSWSEQKSVRDIMVFLQSHGIGTARAVRIYKTYGDEAIAKVTANPYQLSSDIQSVGFKVADTLALRLGIAPDSMQRAEAGICYVLQELCTRGHCAAEVHNLIEESIKLLEIDESIIKEAIKHQIDQEKIMPDKIGHLDCLFPLNLYKAETIATSHLLRIRRGTPPWGQVDVDKAIPWVEQKTGLQLAQSQTEAIKTVLSHKLAIMTGGPGVGKTTVVNSLLKMIQAKGLSIALCAPTGRAAKRLSETTGLSAKTIHRLLGFNVETFSFVYHQNNPLPVDFVVVDEASMLDIILLQHLLKAIPSHAALLFVGDVDQLPSVGSGAVLLDMIQSRVIATVRLTEIFRQAAHSKIIINAHRINQGEMPFPHDSELSDFWLMMSENAAEIDQTLVNLISQVLPQQRQLNPITDIQVLTPMNRGSLGTATLNTIIQQRLNGSAEPKVMRFGVTFSPGDKVIQTVNNYKKEVFNGDIGFIAHINLQEETLAIQFDQRVISYDFSELDEINLAYAISIHKSQGSEFPIVIIPLAMQHYMLLVRNLLYTGVTRAKKLVILLGERKAISMAVRNNRENRRLTKLSQRLQEG